VASDAAGYAVKEIQLPGLLDGKDAAGSAGGTQTGFATPDIISGIHLTAAQNAINYNFGERLGISGTVYVDANADAAQNNAEVGLGGVTLKLYDVTSGSALVGTTTTAADGTYSFTSGLVAGHKYQIVETQPAGYGSSTANTINTVALPATGLANQSF